jgi:hypothetical protein
MRKDALRRYAVYRIKVMEFLDLNALRDGLLKGQINYAGQLRPPIFMAQSVRTVILSYFALFVDKNGMNVIELWKELFPNHKQLVEEVWGRIEPEWKTIREFRDRAGFHADKPMKFFAARYKVNKSTTLDKAVGEFIALVRFFLKAEDRGELPDFEEELDSLLKDLEAAQPEKYQREQFRAYIMLARTERS